MKKGFKKPNFQHKTFWLELKRYFRDGSEIDKGWMKLSLRVEEVKPRRKLDALDWEAIAVRVSVEFVRSLKVKPIPHDLRANHAFLYNSDRQRVIGQFGLQEFYEPDGEVWIAPALKIK